MDALVPSAEGCRDIARKIDALIHLVDGRPDLVALLAALLAARDQALKDARSREH